MTCRVSWPLFVSFRSLSRAYQEQSAVLKGQKLVA